MFDIVVRSLAFIVHLFLRKKGGGVLQKIKINMADLVENHLCAALIVEEPCGEDEVANFSIFLGCRIKLCLREARKHVPQPEFCKLILHVLCPQRI